MAQRPVLGVEAAEDVLPERVVGAALRRRAVDLRPHGSEAKASRSHCLMEYGGLARTTSNCMSRSPSTNFGSDKRVAADDLKVLDAVEEAVHPGDGRGHQVALLAVEADVAPFLALAAQMRDAGEQHAAGAAGGVVDGLARLRLEHLGHQVDDGAVGVELGGGVAGVVGELLDQVLVA